MSNLQDEYQELMSKIRIWRDSYHIRDISLVSDAQYDTCVQRLKIIEELEPRLVVGDSPTQIVGGGLSEAFEKVKHGVPLMSLDNIFDDVGLMSFDQGVKKALGLDEIVYVAEPKIDGLSLNLVYENGVLIRGLTRGDHIFGECVTQNVKMIPDIPLVLKDAPQRIEIRGEVYITKSRLKELNDIRLKNGEKLLSNTRNAASGSLRQLDPNVVKLRGLRFFAYAVGENSGEELDQVDLLKSLDFWGFSVSPLIRVCYNCEDLISYFNDLSALRDTLDYDIDGLVYKVNNLDYRRRLGYTGRAPKWAIAHKFPAQQVETTLRDITLQLGRSGVLTPVAQLDPVMVGGVIVSRATLHNMDFIEQKQIRIGDLVVVQRAGDVVPQIVKSLAHTSSSVDYVFSKTCPVCGSDVVKRDAFMVCSGGLRCSGQAISYLSYLTSRDVFDIVGLGENRITELYHLGLIKRPGDIYRVHKHKDFLENLEGWGKRSTHVLLSNIEEKRQIDFSRFITSLGIKEIGRTLGRLLAQHYREVDVFLDIMKRVSLSHEDAIEDLLSVDTVGDVIVKEVSSWFGVKDNFDMVFDLLSEIDIIEPQEIQETHMSGKTIVFTGSMMRFDRKVIEQMARDRGAKISNSVSKKTDILVHGDKAGSKLTKGHKIKEEQLKAQSDHVISIMTEDQWWDFFDGKD